MFSNHPQGKAVLEGHAGMIANQRCVVTRLLGYDVVQIPIQRANSIAYPRSITAQR
jgi:hypothetical protein